MPEARDDLVRADAAARRDRRRASPGAIAASVEIVGDISSNFSTLVRQEIDLAKTELKQEASTAGKGIGMLAAAAITGLLMLSSCRGR